MILFTIIMSSLLGAPLIWLLQQRSGRAAGAVAALLPASLFVLLLTQLPTVTAGTVLLEKHAWVPSLGVALNLRLDGLALLMALLVTGIGTLVTIYAGSYFRSADVRMRTHFVLLIQLFMSAMLGTVLSDNLIVMYLFWEWTSLMSFLLIGFEAARPEARKAALQSLLVTVAGGLSMFAGILLLGRSLGTFSFTEILADPGRFATLDGAWVIAALFLAGALTKSAQAPFHFWLPRAMEAPTPASAYLHSATMVKLGIFLLARLDQPFSQLPGYGTVLATFGLATMLMASLNTLRERQYKALLAHSTVASLGMLVFLLGLPGSGARSAMLAFLLGHALYKATLFFAAGSSIATAGTGELARLSGLRKALPLTAAAALVAGISMAGLPPLFGFIAKEAMFENLLAQAPGLTRSAGLAGLVIASAVLVAVAWLSGVKPFRGPPAAAQEPGETGGLAAGPVILSGAGILFALFPGFFVTPLLRAAARAVSGGQPHIELALWHGPTPALAWSALVIALGALLVSVWPRLQALLPGPGARVGPTSEGGYETVFEGTLALARRSTRLLQNGDQRTYTAAVIAALTVAGAWLLVKSGSLALQAGGGTFSLSQLVILLLMCAGALTAAITRGLVATLIGAGMVGFGSAVIYLLNGAPDLSLTQFAVEALVLVVLMALLMRLRLSPPKTRSSGERRFDLVLAAAFGLLMFLALAAMLSVTPGDRLAEYYSAHSLSEAFGRNVVNVILVDFRALDTLGELSVIGFAGLIIWSLLRLRRRGED